MTTQPIFALNDTQPDSTAVSPSTWTTRSSLGRVPLSDLPLTTKWCWFSCRVKSANAKQFNARVRDTTNNATLASAGASATNSILVATPTSFTPSNDIDVEFQIQAASGAGAASLDPSFSVNVFFGEK